MKHMSRPPFIIKVCGITNEEDASVSIESGANALGFNFYEKSARYVRPHIAARIASKMPEEVLRVGVFVNASQAQILEIASEVPLDVVQLYGEEIPAMPLRVWRAIAAGRCIPPAEGVPEAYLLDAETRSYGGSGKVFDWTLASNYSAPVILAGGLDAVNVTQAIETTRPWGVDACSRLEAAPGRKDVSRVREFVSAAFQSFRRIEIENNVGAQR